MLGIPPSAKGEMGIPSYQTVFSFFAFGYPDDMYKNPKSWQEFSSVRYTPMTCIRDNATSGVSLLWFSHVTKREKTGEKTYLAYFFSVPF